VVLSGQLHAPAVLSPGKEPLSCFVDIWRCC